MLWVVMYFYAVCHAGEKSVTFFKLGVTAAIKVPLMLIPLDTRQSEI